MVKLVARRNTQKPEKSPHKETTLPFTTDEAVIMAFTNDIKDLKMCEKLAVNDTMSTTMELFNLDDKCAKVEEGRLCASDNSALEDTKAKAKEAKRKGPTTLSAEPK